MVCGDVGGPLGAGLGCGPSIFNIIMFWCPVTVHFRLSVIKGVGRDEGRVRRSSVRGR